MGSRRRYWLRLSVWPRFADSEGVDSDMILQCGPPPAPGRAAPDNENFVLKFAQCRTQKQKTANKRLVIKPVLALSLSGTSEVYACSGMCHGECVARNYSADCPEVLLPATISSDRGYCSCLLFVRLSGSTSAYEPHWTNRITSAFRCFLEYSSSEPLHSSLPP
jgi:hypothetical protein